MMAELVMKLRRSRYTSPHFGDRVTGVFDPTRAIERTALAYPAACVTFLGEDADALPSGGNENWQQLTQHWGVVIGLGATPDIRGQASVMDFETIMLAVHRAIYNWRPPGPGIQGAFWYDGVEHVRPNGNDLARTFWLMTYNIYRRLDAECDGEVEDTIEGGLPGGRPDFLRVGMKVDWQEPFDPGNPPSQAYDPKYPPPRTYGPDGRIESELLYDVPQTPSPLIGSNRWPRSFATSRRRWWSNRPEG
jgi:hypothetical protein